MPGDVLFLVPGILPFIWITWLGVRHGIKPTVTRMEPETLFVVESAAAHADRTGRVAEPVGAPVVEEAGSLTPSRYASDRRDGEEGSTS